jgi:hypothetical protein
MLHAIRKRNEGTGLSFPADALGPMSAELSKDAGCRQSGCGYFRGAAGDAFLAPAKQKPLWHAER